MRTNPRYRITSYNVCYTKLLRAEDCAQKYGFTREAQDAFAIASLKRAQQANTEGWFAWETTSYNFV